MKGQKIRTSEDAGQYIARNLGDSTGASLDCVVRVHYCALPDCVGTSFIQSFSQDPQCDGHPYNHLEIEPQSITRINPQLIAGHSTTTTPTGPLQEQGDSTL